MPLWADGAWCHATLERPCLSVTHTLRCEGAGHSSANFCPLLAEGCFWGTNRHPVQHLWTPHMRTEHTPAGPRG